MCENGNGPEEIYVTNKDLLKLPSIAKTIKDSDLWRFNFQDKFKE